MVDTGAEPLANSRHERFCRALAQGTSATAAYIDAGYSTKTAGRNAHRLLKKDGIRQRIAYLKEQAIDETIMSANEVLARVSDIARNGSDREKLGALNSLMRYYGLFTDRLDYTTGGEALPQVSIYLPHNGRDAPQPN